MHMSMKDYIMTNLMLLSKEVSYDEKDENDLYQVMLRHEIEILDDLVERFPLEYNREVNLGQFKEELEKIGFDFEDWGIDHVQISHGTKNQKINIKFDKYDNKWKVVDVKK